MGEDDARVALNSAIGKLDDMLDAGAVQWFFSLLAGAFVSFVYIGWGVANLLHVEGGRRWGVVALVALVVAQFLNRSGDRRVVLAARYHAQRALAVVEQRSAGT